MSHELRSEPRVHGQGAPADGWQEYTVAQTWTSKPVYEAWMNTPLRRKSHFPEGVWQHSPENKFSVPEEFAPFVRAGKSGPADAAS